MSLELENLVGEAAAVDALCAPVEFVDEAAIQQVAELAQSEAAELAALLSIVTGLFSPVFPSLEKIYTPPTVQRLADSFVPVMVKRGWTTGGILGRFGEEFAFAAVVIPIAIATTKGIKEDIAAAEKSEEKPEEPSKAAMIDTSIHTPFVLARQDG